MFLITITRLKLTHCHQLRAGRAEFHHPSSLHDIAALGAGIKRIICHSVFTSYLRISELLRLISLSGSDHRNQHCPGPQRVCWQGSRYDDRQAPLFTGRAPGWDWAGTVFMFTGGPTRLPSRAAHLLPLSRERGTFYKYKPCLWCTSPPCFEAYWGNCIWCSSKQTSNGKTLYFVEIMFVKWRMGQEEATEGLGTGNDDLNYLMTHH